MERYSRHIALDEIGLSGQQKLLDSRVLVIGAGGLGCPVLQYLAAAGIGKLGVIDFDVVDRTNLQRQILFGESTLGMNKANAACERLEDLNPGIQLKAYPIPLSPENALELFTEYDLIVDGSDNFNTRYLVNDAAVLTNKPVVFGAIYKFEGQVSVFNYKNGPTYRCLFPDIPIEGSVPNCSEVGVLGVLTGIIGSLMANEVLKIILGLGEVLANKVLCYDSRTNTFNRFEVRRDSKAVDTLITKGEIIGGNSSVKACSTPDEIDVKQMISMDNARLIDIREMHETPEIPLDGVMRIPMNSLLADWDSMDGENEPYIIICQHGIRSLAITKHLKTEFGVNCFSLKGGVIELLNHQTINSK